MGHWGPRRGGSITEVDSHLSRRTVIKGASLGVGISLMGPSLVEPAPATIWSGECRARKGDVSLYLFRKQQGAPAAGEPPRPVLFLVHGSSISARPSFDLAVPGQGEYSMMTTFAGYGFDVWTLDHEGYGRSSRTQGNSDIASGVEDLKAGTEVVARETGQARFHFYGGSSGALRAGAFAMVRPERVDRLILEAFTWTGKGSPTLGKRAEGLEYFRTHNRRPRGRDNMFTPATNPAPPTPRWPRPSRTPSSRSATRSRPAPTST